MLPDKPFQRNCNYNKRVIEIHALHDSSVVRLISKCRNMFLIGTIMIEYEFNSSFEWLEFMLSRVSITSAL